MTTIDDYDFKGNPLAPIRTYTEDATRHPDWTIIGSVNLETETYETATVYDALNRPIKLTTPDNGVTKYTYDKGGLLKAVEVENVHSLDSDIVNNIEYNAKGQRTKIQYENGTTTSYEYDAFTFRLRRIRTTRHSDSKELQDLHYWYDSIGNITLQKDLAQQTVYFDGSVAEPHHDYTYDSLYRLIQTEGRELAGNNQAPNHNDSSRLGITPIPIASTDTAKMRRYIQYYEYDEVGNFIAMQHTVTGGTGNWTRHYTTANNSNKLTTTVVGAGTPENYTYDNRGNIVSGFFHLQSLEYNDENRLEKVVIDGNRTAYYQYDYNGQRVRKMIIDINTNISEIRKYVGEWEIYRKFVSSSLTLERETLHISDDTRRIVLIDTRTIGSGSEPAQLLRYQYSNHLQSAILELDDAGAIISYEEYYPYGSTSFQSGRSGSEVSLKRYRYTGKERDEESGLYYHGARYYVPWLARWSAVDPINSENYNLAKGYGLEKNKERDFIELTISSYCYCSSNPVKYYDPTGETQVVNTKGEIVYDDNKNDGNIYVTKNIDAEFDNTKDWNTYKDNQELQLIQITEGVKVDELKDYEFIYGAKIIASEKDLKDFIYSLIEQIRNDPESPNPNFLKEIENINDIDILYNQEGMNFQAYVGERVFDRNGNRTNRYQTFDPKDRRLRINIYTNRENEKQNALSNFIFANVYDMLNTLIHEDDHFLFANDSVIKGKGQVLDLKTEQEYGFWNADKEKRAYRVQARHKTWDKTTEFYKNTTKHIYKTQYRGNPELLGK